MHSLFFSPRVASKKKSPRTPFLLKEQKREFRIQSHREKKIFGVPKCQFLCPQKGKIDDFCTCQQQNHNVILLVLFHYLIEIFLQTGPNRNFL